MSIRYLQLAVVCTSINLAACGGGSNSDAPDSIYPSLSYGSQTITPWSKTVLAPNITGTYGHYAVCSLTSPPTGFTMDRDCNLFIDSPAAGQHNINVNMAVSGYNGLGTFQQVISVSGAKFLYNLQLTRVDASLKLSDSLIWQAPLSAAGGTPKLLDYVPVQGDLVAYKASGALAPGLTLNSATGQLTGTPDSADLLDSKISVEITRNGKTVTTLASIRTELPTVAYANIVASTFDTSLTAKPKALGLLADDTVSYALHTLPVITGTCLNGTKPLLTASQVAIDGTTGSVRPSANVKGTYCIPVAMKVTRNGKSATVPSASLFEIW
jgi:hypothetical protein